MPGEAIFNLTLDLGDDRVPASPAQVAERLEQLAEELRAREQWGMAFGRIEGPVPGEWGVKIAVVIK
jgi:hypothetical protein